MGIIEAIKNELKANPWTDEERMEFFKMSIDKTPDKWLQFHLDNAVKDEMYELAAYIRDKIKKRNEPRNS